MCLNNNEQNTERISEVHQGNRIEPEKREVFLIIKICFKQ